jgi:hypothetical protein
VLGGANISHAGKIEIRRIAKKYAVLFLTLTLLGTFEAKS